MIDFESEEFNEHARAPSLDPKTTSRVRLMSDILRTFGFSQKNNKTNVENSLSSMLADIFKKRTRKARIELVFQKVKKINMKPRVIASFSSSFPQVLEENTIINRRGVSKYERKKKVSKKLIP